jgi:hypothetical protein
MTNHTYTAVVTAENNYMLSTNNNDYDYTEREKKVIELYNQGKNNRNIAKELRMSLRDIIIILRNNQVSHGIVTKDNGNDNNNKSPSQKASQAYELYNKRNKPVEVAGQLCLSEKEATKYYKEYWRLTHLYGLHPVYMEIVHSLPSFLKSYKIFKRKGLTVDNVEWFANAIETGIIKLPELQHEGQIVKIYTIS